MAHIHIARIAINQHRSMYDELAGALIAGLGELGHVCTVAENEIAEGAVNILIGSTIFAATLFRLESRLRGIPYIVYQLEQLDAVRGLLPEHSGYAAVLSKAVRIWDYAPSSAVFLRKNGFPPVQLLPPAYHPGLEKFRPVREPDIDVIFAGSGRPRRTALLDSLAAAGAKVVHLDGVYGKQRDELLARAKIILNIHAWDDLKSLETVRLSYLLANRCFVISETGDHDPYAGGVIYADHAALAATCLDWLRRPAAEREAVAEGGYRAFRATPLGDVLSHVLVGDLSPLEAKKPASLIWPARQDHADEAAALGYWSREGAGEGAVLVAGEGEPETDRIRLLILGGLPSYRHYQEAMSRWLGRVENCGALALLGVGTDPGATQLHGEILRGNPVAREIDSIGTLRILGMK